MRIKMPAVSESEFPNSEVNEPFRPFMIFDRFGSVPHPQIIAVDLDTGEAIVHALDSTGQNIIENQIVKTERMKFKAPLRMELVKDGK